MPIVPIVMALSQFAPSLMKFFGAGEPSQAIAQKVVDIALAVTGAKTPEEALETMKASAEAQAAFHMAVLQQQITLEQLYSAERLAVQMELTKRQMNDMTSDSWLSKNIRPLALIYLLGIVTLQGFNLMTLDGGFLSMIREFTGYALVFYFGGRTIEKVATVAGDVMIAKNNAKIIKGP
jgi:hypothetical protein